MEEWRGDWWRWEEAGDGDGGCGLWNVGRGGLSFHRSECKESHMSCDESATKKSVIYKNP